MTTRTLILIRHGKAADGSPDVERPLADRGRRDSAAVGRYLAASGIESQRAIVSPAVRARQTWDGVQAELPEPVPVEQEDRIYANDPESLLAVLRDTPAEVQSLVLVGHNPSFEELARALDNGSGDAAARRQLGDGFSTCGVAVFEFASWDDAAPGTATLRSYSVPRG